MYNTLEDYLDEIENFSARRERIPKEAMPYIEAVWKLQQEKVELYRKVLKNLLPELNGEFFICGHSTERENNLPKHIHVCPEYGADIAVIYERLDGVGVKSDVLEKINEDK